MKKLIAPADHLHIQKFDSPLGFLYITGDRECLRGISFFIEPRLTDAIINIKEEENHEIHNCLMFFKNYFSFEGADETGTRYSVHHAQCSGAIMRLRLTNKESGAMDLNLDMRKYSQKEISVFMSLLSVHSGETVSYDVLAHTAEIPGGARFVGNTMAKNRFPILIPCHRVIKKDRGIGNYSAGIEIKKTLLQMEGNPWRN